MHNEGGNLKNANIGEKDEEQRSGKRISTGHNKSK
jgi:hypothetical protein